ncbi:DUF1687-domain-containing protein [Suhomyces tanzawaensis NRRL Y-17324]|uniref:DUF1687-domain-containing protein n=1 Tax=Suhomyces tanzawaensis NRRL Y-17324 TaxID=984487 RepID=A0A1E4SM63_9ASCO|nr:DUF1687-domain-containing protein [Suhomyces tanzawaensis NRRL Y-17324]ODV80600.1 DUF1687-domain-containing protein [Suhomyces tanzawaensis NRRL Y-17324]
MSLFRTLQNSPATISIFHNNKVPLSTKLYQILERAEAQLDEKFRIDLMANKIPTFDQYQAIANSLHSRAGRTALNDCYPFLHDQRNLHSANQTVTFKGVEPTKIFNEHEYSIISEIFQNAVEGKEDGTEDADPVHIFEPPLVVDWDQNLIARDESLLQTLLAKYQ